MRLSFLLLFLIFSLIPAASAAPVMMHFVPDDQRPFEISRGFLSTQAPDDWQESWEAGTCTPILAGFSSRPHARASGMRSQLLEDAYITGGNATVVLALEAPAPLRIAIEVREGAGGATPRDWSQSTSLANGSVEALFHPGMDHPQVTPIEHQGDTAYVVRIPLQAEHGHIPWHLGFHARIDVRLDGTCQQPAFALLSAGEWRTGIELDVVNPLRIDTSAQFIGDDLVLHAHAVSPFGGHDVPVALGDRLPQAPRMTFPCASDVPVDVWLKDRNASLPHPLGHDHGHVYAAAELAIIVNASQLPAGLCTMTVEAQNVQGTAKASANMTVAIGPTDLPPCEGWNAQGCAYQQPSAKQGAPLALWPVLVVVALANCLRSRPTQL